MNSQAYLQSVKLTKKDLIEALPEKVKSGLIENLISKEQIDDLTNIKN